MTNLYAGIPIIMMSAINTKEPFFNFSPEIDGEYLPVDCFLHITHTTR